MSKKPTISTVIEDENSKHFSLKIKFSDIYGERKSIIVPRALLSDQRRLIIELNNHGANIKQTQTNQAVLDHIRTSEKYALHQYRAKDLGWQLDGSFVSFLRTLKSDNSNSRETIAPVSPFTSHMVERGRLSEWKKAIARNAKYSSPMVFSICTAFAAATLKTSDLNTFGFILVGPTKIGKSCILLAAGSIIGFPEEKRLPNFRGTEPAIEELTASFNDHVLLINEGELVTGETSEKRAQNLRAFAYRLAEGQSKGFSQTVKRPRSFYRTIFIGSMEHHSVPHQHLTKLTQTSGSVVRVFDILAATKNSIDIFDRAPVFSEDEGRKKWADKTFAKIRKAAKNYCGVAYRPYVEHLIKDPKTSHRFLNKEAAKFFDNLVTPNDDPAVRHIAKYFSHIVAAGLLARKLKILPWSSKLIEASAIRCFNRAIKLLPTEKAFFRQALKDLITELKTGSIVDLSKKNASTAGLDIAKGYYCGHRKNRVVTIKGQAFISLVGSNVLAFRLLQKWDKAGLIISRNRKAKACKCVKDFESQTNWPNGERSRSIQIQWNSEKIKRAIR